MWRSTAVAGRLSVIRSLGRNLRYPPPRPPQVLFKPLDSSSSSSWFSHFATCSPQFASSLEGNYVRKVNCNPVKTKSDVLDLLNNNVDDDEFYLESTLDSMDLCLDEKFVLEVLSDMRFPLKHLSGFLRWVSSKKEFWVTISTLDEARELFVGFGSVKYLQTVNVYALWEFVKEIAGGKEKNKGLLLNAEILNDFLSAFCILRNEEVALEVYRKFEEFGCIPNENTYYHTIETLLKNPKHAYDQEAILVCQKMLDTGMLPKDVWKTFGIIRLLCDGDRAKEAHAIYVVAEKTGIISRDPYGNPWLYGISRLVQCLAKADETVHLALKELLSLGDNPAELLEYDSWVHHSFLWVIRGLCRIKDIEGAKKLLFWMIEKGIQLPWDEVFHSVIECLSEAGNLEEATEILKLAEGRGLTPKVSSYNIVMNGYAEVGSTEEAYEVLLAAKKKHTKHCRLSLYTLIRAYCKVGQFYKALKLFLELKEDYGVVPNVYDYKTLIQLFSLCLRDLDRETAQKLLEEMREKGVYVPHITEGLTMAVKDFQHKSGTGGSTVTFI